MTSLLRISITLILVFIGSTAFAYWPYSCYFWGSPYSDFAYPDVPYFAIHPPVYYANVVARSYGWSPFPHPLDTAYFQYSAPTQSPIIFNEYVNQKSQTQVSSMPPCVPLRIANPFVKQESDEKLEK
jgi:hypothetical protein